MAVVIRMMRAGAKKRPFYRIVAADSRRQRDGRFLEILGHYDPLTKPYTFKINEDRVKAWIANGAQPSEQAASLLRTINIVAAKASKPTSTAAEKAEKKTAKKKAPVKRAKPREKTVRREKQKAGRAKKKLNPKKRQPKKK